MKYKLFVNSLPKSGTNLLQKLVELIGFKYSNRSLAASSLMGNYKFLKYLIRSSFSDFSVNIGLDYDVCVSNKWINRQLNIKNGYYLSGHAAYSEYLYFKLFENDFRTIIIVRDPRDVIISSIFYTKKNKDHLLYNFCKDLTFEELFYLYLNGGNIGKYFINSYSEVIERILKWKNKDQVMFVKFEDLIGEKGGGSKDMQLNELKKIKDFMNIDFDDLFIIDNLYGNTKTFRKGTIFQWKNELSKKMIEDINSKLEDFIKNLGYEL